MKSKNFRKVVENAEDKFRIIADPKVFKKYDITIEIFIDTVKEFLSDTDKARLFELEHILAINIDVKSKLLEAISDDAIKMQIIENVDLGLEGYGAENMIKKLGEDARIKVLHRPDLIKKFRLEMYNIEHIIESLSEGGIISVLSEISFVFEELGLMIYQIEQIIASIKSEDKALEIIDMYVENGKFNNYQVRDILQTFSDEGKIEAITQNKYGLDIDNLEDIIETLSISGLIKFLNQYRQFLAENGMCVCNVTALFSRERQLEIVERINDLDLSVKDKQLVLALLRNEVKAQLDTSNMPVEYAKAISMQIGEDPEDIGTFRKIIVDLGRNLADYRDFDEYIVINPIKVSEENRGKLLELYEICPKINITDNIGKRYSTVEEYIRAEEWISEVLSGIFPNWSQIQKVAYVDNQIGRRISYTPDFETEVCDSEAARALWKIIDSGYGVCNGIAQVEQYILGRLGIEAERISSGKHSFLKLKNIEIPTDDGPIVGDTVLDPTWDLTEQRYSGKPQNFCLSYEEIRKHDINYNGEDTECHKNDEELASATLLLDDKHLREVYKSIGLTKEDGTFPIGDFIDASDEIDKAELSSKTKVRMQLDLIARYRSDFARCQNSTMGIIQEISLAGENLNYNRSIVNRVYDRQDKDKRPVMYVYVDLPGEGKVFYFADKEKGEFLELDQKAFEERFECYELDEYRPWAQEEEKETPMDLTRSSGTIVASEGEER